MNLSAQFKEYLLSKASSKATVKNYLSDISKFIRWFEVRFNKSFEPSEINYSTIELFRTESSEKYSASSVERSISTLRKFFTFLKLEGIISSSPFDVSEASKADGLKSDPWRIKDFKNHLYVFNASHLTIKNYIIDIKQFASWADKVLVDNSSWEVNNVSNIERLDSRLIEEYKKRLINEAGLSPISVNRKLSSLRRYLAWAEQEGIIKSNIQVLNESKLEGQMPIISDIQTQAQIEQSNESSDKNLSWFPPLRLAQKAGFFLTGITDALFILPLVQAAHKIDYVLWIAKGRPVADAGIGLASKIFSSKQSVPVKIKNVKKEFYAPALVSTKYFPMHKKVWHHVRNTRPEWYRRYQSYSFVRYMQAGILMLLISVLGYAVYSNIDPNKQQPKTLAALPTAPPRVLSFQGRLTDATDNPITSQTPVRFAIYNSPSASGAALLWQEIVSPTPDTDGIFSVILGNNTTIPQSVFAENSALYLGVTIEQTPELTPRQQIATVAFATNAETLQGLEPIINSSNTSNVVLALNSSGNLSIGGSANPTFQATGGSFTLQGTTLVLSTTTGSNGNVQLIPNGIGKIDVSKPILNSTNNNNISTAVGAVEVNDLFAILATSSGQSAFTLNQTSTGPLISASTSGIARFTVDNAGNMTAAGTINGLTVSNGTISSGTWNGTAIGSQYGGTGLNTSASTGVPYISGGTWSVDANFLAANHGGTGIGSYTTGDLIYASGATTLSKLNVGTATQCLIGGTTPTWGSCATGGTDSPFQVLANTGSISPLNSTLDFLVGGQATTSAKFAVLNVNGTRGLQTASVSGSIVLDSSTASIQTTLGQTLSIGGSTTGLVNIYNKSGSAFTTFDTVNGRVGIGTSAPLFKLSVDNGASGSVLGLQSTDTSTLFSLGNISGSSGYRMNLTANSIQVIDQVDLSNSNLLLSPNGGNVGIGGDTTPNALLSVGSTSQFQVNSSGAIAAATGITSSGTITFSGFNANNNVMYATVSTGQLAGASTNSTGLCLLSGASAPSWGSCGSSGSSNWVLNSGQGTLNPINNTLDVLVGGTATSSAKFSVLNVNSGTPTASVSSGTGGTSAYLTADGTLATQNRMALTIGNSSTYNTSGNVLINPNGTGRTAIGTTVTSSTNSLAVGGNSGTLIRLFPGTGLISESAIISLNSRGSIGYNGTSQAVELSDADAQKPLLFLTSNGGSSTERMRIGTDGNVNIGADSTPDALFTVGSTSQFQVNSSGAIAAVTGFTQASGAFAFSGAGNFSVDSAAFDVTTAGAVSGVTTLGASGVVTLSNAAYTGNNAVIYGTVSTGQLAAATTSTANLCLISGAGATYTPSWGSCATGGTDSPFQVLANTGSISPLNSTLDFLVGGQATTSAKFAVLNVNGTRGLQTASVSGSIVLDSSTASIQTTLGQTLSIGGSTTGLVNIYNKSGSAFTTFDTVNSRIGVGTTTPGYPIEVSTNQNAATQIRISNTDSGASAYTMYSALSDNSARVDFGIGSSGNTANVYNNRAFMYASSASNGLSLVAGGSGDDIRFFTGGEASTNERLRLTGTGLFGIGATPTSALYVTRPLTFTVSGKALAVFDQIENQDIIAASASGSRVFTVDRNGNLGLATSIPSSSNYITAPNFSVTTGGAITAATTSTINSLNISSGALSGVTGFTQSSGAFAFSGGGNFSVDSAAFDVTTAGAVSGVTTLNASGQVTLSNYNANNNVLYATVSTGVVAGASTNSTGLCLTSGASAPTWAACPGGSGSNYWQFGTGTLAPGNLTLDFLLGSTATTSAKFGVLGINGTGPATATVAGNMVIMPQNGSGGYLGIGDNTPETYIDIVGDRNSGSRVEISNSSTGTNAYASYQAWNNSVSGVAEFGVTGTGYTNVAGWQNIAYLFAGSDTDGLMLATGGSTDPILFVMDDTIEVARFSGTTNLFGLGTSAPISQFHLTRPTTFGATGKALAIFDQIENQDIFTASSSGVTKYAIDRFGNATNSGSFLAQGPYIETSTERGVHLGRNVSDNTPRILFANGTAAQNWQIDNNAGSFRWYLPGATHMTLTSTSLTLSSNTITSSSLATFTTAATLGMTSTTTLNLGNNATLSSNATALNLEEDGGVDVNIAGTSAGTGCTITNSSGNLACAGTATFTTNETINGIDISAGTITDVAGLTLNAGANYAMTSGTGTFTQTFSGTTTDAMTITAASLTTGSGLVLSGPTGGTAGATDALFKISGDIGDINSANGLISSTATFDTTTTTADGINLYLSSTNSPTTNANTGYGIYNTIADSTALANQVYGAYNNVALSGNAAKTGYAMYNNISTSSTTADTIYAFYLNSTTGTAISTGTRNIYGVFSEAGSLATNTGGTINTYGGYFLANIIGGGGTQNQYGVYIGNGSSSTTGTTTKYGLYVADQTGADTNYAAYFVGGTVQVDGSVGINSWDLDQNATCAGSGRLCFSYTGTAMASITTGGQGRFTGGTATGTPDYAENITVLDQSIESGDIVTSVVYDTTEDNVYRKSVASKSDKAYQNEIIGAISENPGFLAAQGNLDELPDDRPWTDSERPLTVAGRIPIKVTTQNGPISVGDRITSSSISGVGMKATEAGRVVGIAMEPYNNSDPNAVGKILVFINPQFYDPDVILTDSGYLSIAPSVNSNFEIKRNNESFVRIAGYSEVVSAKIRAGRIEAVNIVTNIFNATTANITNLTTETLAVATSNITIAGQNITDFISGIVDQRIAQNGGKGNIISPIELEGENIVAKLPESDSKFVVKNSSGSAVASIDNDGNASISGKLKAESVETDEASVSGTLRAKKIIADEIEGLNIKSSTVSANYITNNYYISTPSSAFGPSENASNSSNLNFENATGSAIFGNLSAQTATFTNGLMSFGPTSFFEASVADRLFIGSQLSLANNSINVLGGNLEIQPLGQGGVSFVAGLVEIDTRGNLKVDGNAFFAKDVDVKGRLATNIISPLSGQDLIFDFIASGSAVPSNIQFRNGTDSAVLAINNKGDILSSGSGTFAKLNINLVAEAQALSDTEIIATGSAGLSEIKANQEEITIINPLVTEKSLIYITPKTSTPNQSVYLLRQTAEDKDQNGIEGSFTVGISNPINKKVPFNWIIIN